MSEHTRRPRSSGRLTAITLFAIAGLHVAWGLGSSFPFQNREELADSVVGRDEMPSMMACMAVASLLVLAATLVAGLIALPLEFVASRFARSRCPDHERDCGRHGSNFEDLARSESLAFVRLDKRLYSPLCLCSRPAYDVRSEVAVFAATYGESSVGECTRVSSIIRRDRGPGSGVSSL